MKPRYKHRRRLTEPWSGVGYIDFIYYGRNVGITEVTWDESRMRLPAPGVRPLNRREWEDIVFNTAWYNGLNPAIIWDKPKKDLLDNWKRDGRLIMHVFLRRQTDA